jgi:thioredoxin 1
MVTGVQTCALPILIHIQLAGKMKVVKVDVDEAQDLAGRFNIMSIPTMLIFKGGEAVDTVVGAVPKEQILKKINPHIA